MSKQAILVAGMAFLGGATATVVGIRVQGVRAEVPGTAERLSYSGVLLQGTAPVTGSKTIRVRFFDGPVNGSALTCAPPDTVVDLTKTAGHFHVNVSDCVEELEAAANAFVEVTLDPAGTPQVFPPAGTARPRVGAVPYAGQALKAQVSQVATQALAPVPGSPLDRLASPHICGLAPATSGQFGATDGYRAGALKCRAVAGCNANATVCTSTDVVRFLSNNGAAQLPTAVEESAWIATGTFAQARGGTANIFDDDCASFTSGAASTQHVGMRVSLSNSGSPGLISDADCSNPQPSLCCDY